jgi:adenosylhomocysteine nucleosidase
MTGVQQYSTIGLLAPMPSEFQPLVKALGMTRGESGWTGAIGGVQLFAGKTGIGTKRATDATERLLDRTDADYVMVVGIAGGMGSSKVGDVFVPEVVVDKATRAEYRATPIGDMHPRGRLVTHDDFDMQPPEHQALVADGFIAVDMETAAVAAVCEKRGVPWSAVRAISDLVGVTPGDVIGLANPDGSPNLGAALTYMITKPWRIPKLVGLAAGARKATTAAAATAARALGT